MSGIGSIGGSSSDNYPWLRQLTSASSSQSADATVDESDSLWTVLSTDSTTPSDDTLNLDDLQQKVTAAIEEALQNSADSSDSTDLLTIIQQAIEDAFKEAGIDLDNLKSQMRGMRPPPGPPPGPPPEETSETSSASGSTSTSTDSSDSEDTNVSFQTQISEALEDWLYEFWSTQDNDRSVLGFLFDQKN